MHRSQTVRSLQFLTQNARRKTALASFFTGSLLSYFGERIEFVLLAVALTKLKIK
jgi:hypothetical protein